MEQKSLDVFEKSPISTAVFKNTRPAMAAMLMVLIYNLADTFFIGQTHDALQVAAVSLATPIFWMFMSVGMDLGTGGTAAISRALGEQRTDYACKLCSFCMWSCIGIGIVMAGLFLIFMNPILSAIGASQDTWDFAKTYLIIVVCSGPAVLICNCFSSVIRAEGESGKAMMGQMIGNLLNIILDPILILGFGWNIAGAAAATVIGNVCGAAFYILYFVRGKSALSISPRLFTFREKVFSGIFEIGGPAALGYLLMTASVIIVNMQMAYYGDMAIAGIGVAMKVTTITSMVCTGLVWAQPLADVLSILLAGVLCVHRYVHR